MVEAVLVTGGNTGPIRENLLMALELIGERLGEVRLCSGIYESEPWGEVSPGEYCPEGSEGESGKAGNFLNQAVVVKTSLEPLQLLGEIKEIEREFGRRRPETVAEQGLDRKYYSRTMDIDIIFYGNSVLQTPELTLPHPLMQRREFVLRPLAGIIPGWKHPVSGESVACMLENLKKGDRH